MRVTILLTAAGPDINVQAGEVRDDLTDAQAQALIDAGAATLDTLNADQLATLNDH